ncbi:hypothetical protein GCM10023169_07340 [Georgenia halophila]|uniref:Uncharacterized protein n=1 Tax=Georgenia halophila TaxID=620889 RepID=A0ABP8KWG1_9MICO
MSTDGGPRESSQPYRDLLAAGPPATRPSSATPGHAEPDGEPARPDQENTPDITVVVPGELSTRPYPGVRPATSVPGPAPRPSAPPTPRPRPRFRRYYGLAAMLVLGAGIAGAVLTVAAGEARTDWDVEISMQQQVTMDLPPAETRWIWAPESHVDDVACTATDSTGADLPMSAAPSQSHDDYESVFRFPTGNGAVTMTCDVTAEAASVWQPGSTTLWVGEPAPSELMPFLQAAVLLLFGGPAVGVLVLVVTVLAQIGHAVVGTVRSRTGERQTSRAARGEPGRHREGR